MSRPVYRDRLLARLSIRLLGKEFIQYQMRPYIFGFLLLVALSHVGFGLYFFLEAMTLSSTPKEALDTAIAYVVVNSVLLGVYFGSLWIYSAVMHRSAYDKYNIEVVRNVWTLHATMILIPINVAVYLWLNYYRQHSVEDEDRDEYYVGPVPTHSIIMFLAFAAELILLLSFIRRIWHTLSRSYTPALMAKVIEAYHLERMAPV